MKQPVWALGFALSLGMGLFGQDFPGALPALAASAEPGQHNINWNALPLTTQQKDAMRKHDEVWQRAFEQLYPEIIAERKHLNALLLSQETDPEAVFQALRHLEDKEQELRYEAVKNFLMKKQELTTDQRKLLQPSPSAISGK